MQFRFSRLFGWLKVPALLLSRLTIGMTFVHSGWGKLHNLQKVSEFFTDLGIPHANIVAPFTAANELLFGTLILVGLATRLAVLPLGVIMLVALRTAKWDDITDFSSLLGTAEFLYVVILIWIAGEGAGKLSLDYLICRAKNRNFQTKAS